MKTTLRNFYAFTNQILMALVGGIFGYNLYQALVHPEKSHLLLSLALVALTYYVSKKYGYKISK